MNNEDKQKVYAHRQKEKRRKFLIRIGIPYLILAIFIFIFGYDTPMFDENKIIEFLPPFFFIALIIFFISLIKYRIASLCPHCGIEIKNVKKDCVVDKTEFLGTVDKTEYKKVRTTIKGKTVYPRGGYSMRNSVMEHTSESTYEVEQEVPVVKKYYVYNIEYRCKNCNEVIYNFKEESSKPLHTANKK